MDFAKAPATELVALLDLTRDMAEQRLVTPLLHFIVEAAFNLVGAERGYVVLFGPDDALDFRVTRDQAGQIIADAEDQISRSVLSQVRKTLQPLVVSDAFNDDDFRQSRSVHSLQLRSIMCIPLTSYGTARGAIYLENRSLRGRFKPEDTLLLALFAQQAVIALDNAERNEQLEARVATRTADLNTALLNVQKANQQLDQALREVNASNIRLQGVVNMARFMQHEVRGYAVGLEGVTPIMRKALLSHPQASLYVSLLEGLEQTVTQMNELAQQMLILSREGVLPKRQQQPVPLLPIVEQVRSKALALAQRYELPLRITITGALDAVVHGDALYLSLALNTGLRNAVEVLADDEHNTDPTVDLTIIDAADHVRIIMRDNGPGFPPTLLETIVLARQNTGDFMIGWSSKVGGSGLGLALIDRVAQLHSGSLAIGNNANNAGAWLELTLPH